MTYRIDLSPESEAEILDAARFIARDSHQNAQRWYEGIFEAIMSLDEMPHRCAYAREKETLNLDLSTGVQVVSSDLLGEGWRRANPSRRSYGT